MIPSPSILSLLTLRNKSVHEQLCSLFSRNAMSSLALVIGPQVTQVWDIFDLCGGEKGWVVYHNNQRLRNHKVPVHHGDFFACYERSDSNTPVQADRPVDRCCPGVGCQCPNTSA